MTISLRVLIADDESTARKRIVRLVDAMPDVEVVKACADADEVLESVREEDVDVVLLDIAMPGLSGLEASAILPEDGPLVIFVTAYPEHAVEAFDVGALDYLVKPVDAARLRKALDRARRQLIPAARSGTERLAIPTHDGVVLVDPSTVTHATLDGELVCIESTTEGRLLSDMSLAELGRRLSAHGFERVHRRALVNLALVRTLRPTDSGGYTAITTAGAEVPVSRQAARRLRRRLGLTVR
jgi:two-component system LytT family response regulator